MALNLDGSSDPFYRYTMPPLKIRHLTTKGGQTLLVNLEELVKALGLNKPKPLLKFLGKELGCRINEKTLCLPGQISQGLLQDKIFKFIQRYILCRSCGNPETTSGVCKACGLLVKPK